MREPPTAGLEFLGQPVALPAPREQVVPISALEVSDAIAPSRELVDSVRRFGVIAPVVLFDDSGRLRVADGRRRIAAAALAGLDSLPAVVYAGGAFLPDLVAVVLNEQRRDNPVADLRAIQRLQQRGATEREIAEATGMPLGRIRRRMKLAALRAELLAGQECGALSVAVAESCAGLPAALQARLLECLNEKGKLTMPDVQAARSTRKAHAANMLTLEGMGDLLQAAPAPASMAEVVAALSTHTLRRVLAELPAEPRLEAARQAVERELAEAWRAPLAAGAFSPARAPARPTAVPAHSPAR